MDSAATPAAQQHFGAQIEIVCGAPYKIKALAGHLGRLFGG